MEKVILYVDDALKHLAIEQLEEAGYVVLTAESQAEAKEKLAKRRIHLMIVDVRLTDNNNPQDYSGLRFIQETRGYGIPHIFYTAYSQEMFDQDILDFINNSGALGIATKEAGSPLALLNKVNEAFATHVPINWNLMIRRQNAYEFSLAHLALSMIDIEDRVFLEERIKELEDNFRQLFSEYQQITFGKLLLQEKNKFAMQIYAYKKNGTETQFIVSCGKKEILAKEDKNFSVFADERMNAGTTSLGKSVQTFRFGATAYQLVEGEFAKILPFAEAFDKMPASTIQNAITYLFDKTLNRHAVKRELVSGGDLKQRCLNWAALPLDKNDIALFSDCLAKLCQEATNFDHSKLPRLVYNKETIRPDFGDEASLNNPLKILANSILLPPDQIRHGIIHGQINGDNLLASEEGHTWLINFIQSGKGPLVFDYVSLEIAIKFTLMQTANLPARFAFDKYLLTTDTESEIASLPDTDLQKSLNVILHLRKMALADVGGQLEGYLYVLLFATLGYLRSYQPQWHYTLPELIRYCHALLSASLIYKKLAKPENNEELTTYAKNSVWIDPSPEAVARREVVVEKHRISIPQREYDMLGLLYKHAKRDCPRKFIAAELFNYPTYDTYQKDNINKIISELRKSLEPYKTPDHEYIKSVRGVGYRFVHRS